MMGLLRLFEWFERRVGGNPPPPGPEPTYTEPMPDHTRSQDTIERGLARELERLRTELDSKRRIIAELGESGYGPEASGIGSKISGLEERVSWLEGQIAKLRQERADEVGMEILGEGRGG